MQGVSSHELPVLVEKRNRVVDGLKALGYKYVTLDLAGFRSGSLNEVLPLVEVTGR